MFTDLFRISLHSVWFTSQRKQSHSDSLQRTIRRGATGRGRACNEQSDPSGRLCPPRSLPVPHQCTALPPPLHLLPGRVHIPYTVPLFFISDTLSRFDPDRLPTSLLQSISALEGANSFAQIDPHPPHSLHLPELPVLPRDLDLSSLELPQFLFERPSFSFLKPDTSLKDVKW